MSLFEEFHDFSNVEFMLTWYLTYMYVRNVTNELV